MRWLHTLPKPKKVLSTLRGKQGKKYSRAQSGVRDKLPQTYASGLNRSEFRSSSPKTSQALRLVQNVCIYLLRKSCYVRIIKKRNRSSSF